MEHIKEQICQSLEDMKQRNLRLTGGLTDRVFITDYNHLVRQGDDNKNAVSVWTDALNTALREHQVVVIPPREQPYYMDSSIIVPSNRHIIATGAVIRQMTDVRLLLLRNEHVHDGTHFPFSGEDKDCNIAITGGRWEESYNTRVGYGSSGRVDESQDFFGVGACMLFNNLENLTVTDVTFSHAAGFAIQTGNVRNAVFENITFEHCFGDGVHVNGNTENVLIRHIQGEVGDDLVALNMYDWLNSSVTFGPMRNVLCEHLNQYETSHYKALRILPGVYYYDDGTGVDCSANDLIIRDVKGIRTFKMYFQTPRYDLGTEPERGDVGTGNNIFFENISIDLTEPVDGLPVYVHSDPLRGYFGAFEINANLGTVVLENIDITLHKDQYPLSRLVCIGPKSACSNNSEAFDPYLSSVTQKLILKNITVNGSRDFDVKDIVQQISFNDINQDGHSTGSGKVLEIEVI